MIEYLSLSVFLLLLFLISLYLLTILNKFHNDKSPKSSTIQKVTTKTTSDEILDSLNWMLQYQIIDTFQYNQLLLKCLPYFK